MAPRSRPKNHRNQPVVRRKKKQKNNNRRGCTTHAHADLTADQPDRGRRPIQYHHSIQPAVHRCRDVRTRRSTASTVWALRCRGYGIYGCSSVLRFNDLLFCETDGHESKPSSKGRSRITTGEKPHSYRRQRTERTASEDPLTIVRHAPDNLIKEQ